MLRRQHRAEGQTMEAVFGSLSVTFQSEDIALLVILLIVLRSEKADIGPCIASKLIAQTLHVLT